MAAAHAAAIRVEPIPGPSAVLAAVSASGLASGEFVFVGFPPSRSSTRTRWLEGLAKEPRLLVLYEAPHRVRHTLEAMLQVLGDRRVALGRELTKAHEELVVRPISQHLSEMREPLGEYTLVVAPANAATSSTADVPDDEVVAAEFGELTNNADVDRREALGMLASKYGLPKREVYAILERAKNSGH